MRSLHSFRNLATTTVLCLLAGTAGAQNPVAELVGPQASIRGSLVLAGGDSRVMSGATVSAGMSNATLKLQRGGELRVCRGSSVSVTRSATGNEVMIGLSSGAIEAHYTLDASTDAAGDSIMTPDFQIQLPSPGTFHFAVSADERGNTCLQALPANSGSVRISELMGDGVYILQPNEQVFFRGGRLNNPEAALGNCGCPVPVPVWSAKAEPPPSPAAGPSLASAGPAAPPPVLPVRAPTPHASEAALPVPPPGEIHVQVDAPFVFRASESRRVPDAPYNMARIQLSSLPALPASDVLPPSPNQASSQVTAEQKPKKKKKGFWGLLSSIFRG